MQNLCVYKLSLWQQYLRVEVGVCVTVMMCVYVCVCVCVHVCVRACIKSLMKRFKQGVAGVCGVPDNATSLLPQS